METTAAIAMMMAGPFVSMIVVLANAKKINAQYRERRAAKRALQAAPQS